MTSQVGGWLVWRGLERVDIATAGGVTYELLIPLGVYETLPRTGEPVVLHTHLVVKEDAWQLFGFSSPFERRVFQRVLNAKAVGPSLAFRLLSTLTTQSVVHPLPEKDIATLPALPRVGRN